MTSGTITGLNTDPDSTYEIWMYMARPGALSTSGWRRQKGDKVNFAMIAKESSILAQTNSQWTITLANATQVFTTLSLIAACISTNLF